MQRRFFASEQSGDVVGVAGDDEECEQGDGVSPAGIGIGADRRADFERELAENA